MADQYVQYPNQTLNLGPTEFVRDGANQQVTEDTVTPANNRPLPVELIDSSGNKNTVTADQGTAAALAGAWPVEVTDGVNTLPTMDVAARAGFVKPTDGTNSQSYTAAGESKVDITQPLPAGTNVIGHVDVDSEPATEADATLGLPAVVKVVAGYDGANVRTIKTDASGNVEVVNSNLDVALSTLAEKAQLPAALGQTTGAASLSVVLASDQGTVKTLSQGKSKANAPVRNDYSATNVTTAAYVVLVASTSLAASEIEIFDSSGQTLVLAFGAAGAEVDQINIVPGGNGRVPLSVPASTRVSIKAVSATASTGEIDINFYG